jgi:hypothetical protein
MIRHAPREQHAAELLLRLRARARREPLRKRPVSHTARSPAKGGCDVHAH